MAVGCGVLAHARVPVAVVTCVRQEKRILSLIVEDGWFHPHQYRVVNVVCAPAAPGKPAIAAV